MHKIKDGCDNEIITAILENSQERKYRIIKIFYS